MDDTILIQIQRLFQLAHERGVRELSLTNADLSVAFTAGQAGTLVFTPASPVASAANAVPPAEVAAAPTGIAVVSPLVGTFYRSTSPDVPPCVEIGDMVEVGQTIGIVEAMKVFNEITADYAGRVIAIPAENGKLVQAEQPLVILEPSA